MMHDPEEKQQLMARATEACRMTLKITVDGQGHRSVTHEPEKKKIRYDNTQCTMMTLGSQNYTQVFSTYGSGSAAIENYLPFKHAIFL